MEYIFIDVYDDGYSINIEVCYPWDSKDEVVKYEHTLPLKTVCGHVVISKRVETNTSLNGGQLPIVKLPVDKCIIEYHY